MDFCGEVGGYMCGGSHTDGVNTCVDIQDRVGVDTVNFIRLRLGVTWLGIS